MIRKRQGERRKNSFLERKKILHKKENEFTMSTSLDGGAMKQLIQQFHKIFFHILKCLACNAEKLLQWKITKNLKNIYTNIYTYIICDTNESK